MQQGKNSHRASSKSKNRAISSSIGRNTHRPAGSVLQTLNPCRVPGLAQASPELWGCTRGDETELASLGKPPQPRRWASLTPQIAAGTWGVGGKEGRDLTPEPTGKARWGGFCTKRPLTCPPSLWQEPHSPTGGTAGHPATQRTCCHAPPTFQNKTSKHLRVSSLNKKRAAEK